MEYNFLKMSGKIWKTGVFLLATVGTTSALAGELTPIQPCSKTDTICTYAFDGAISANDVQKFSSILIRSEDQQAFLNIKSMGGDINAAVKIARIIQTRGVATIVTDDNPCFSSCVLLLASGVTRIPNQNIGIHRVYSTAPNQTLEEKQQLFDKIEGEIKTILRKSGVSESLWDEMQRIPSENIRILSERDLDRLGLKGESPAYVDYIQNRQAANFGITRGEFIARNAISEKRCTKPTTVEQFNQWTYCRNAILRGK